MLTTAIAAAVLALGVPGLAPPPVTPAAVSEMAAASMATPRSSTTPPAGTLDDTVTDDTADGVVVEDTINEFLPEERGLGDCLGAVERPGCGSKARGGWHQGLVFLALVLALAFIAWRIVRAARRPPPPTRT